MAHGGVVVLGVGVRNGLYRDHPGSLPILGGKGQRGGLHPNVTVGGRDVQRGFAGRLRIQMHLVGTLSTLFDRQVRL